jgi:hypothetical protein
MTTHAQARCFEPGFRVGLRLSPGTAPHRAYVGEVVATDEHGIRMTLVDTEAFAGQDMYVPWANIEMAYVATPDHTLPDGELNQWQEELSYEDEDYEDEDEEDEDEEDEDEEDEDEEDEDEEDEDEDEDG